MTVIITHSRDIHGLQVARPEFVYADRRCPKAIKDTRKKLDEAKALAAQSAAALSEARAALKAFEDARQAFEDGRSDDEVDHAEGLALESRQRAAQTRADRHHRDARRADEKLSEAFVEHGAVVAQLVAAKAVEAHEAAVAAWEALTAALAARDEAQNAIPRVAENHLYWHGHIGRASLEGLKRGHEAADTIVRKFPVEAYADIAEGSNA